MWTQSALHGPQAVSGYVRCNHGSRTSFHSVASSSRAQSALLSCSKSPDRVHHHGADALVASAAVTATPLTFTNNLHHDVVHGQAHIASGCSHPFTTGPVGGSNKLAAVQEQQQKYGSSGHAPAPQHWRQLSSTPLAGGVLEVVQWEGRRNIRVWLPPGYSKEEGRKQPWPVLYFNDGQNLFGDCDTLSGDSWCVAHTAAALINSGRLPPFLVVGLDHAGPVRSHEYTPYTPGTGPGGFRCDAAQWPGGGVSAYLARLHQEVLPWMAGEYCASVQPDDLALAGSSLGGVAALAAGMSAQTGGGCGFGALLLESPSMWIAEEAFLRDVQAYTGPWPQRVYIGMGGKEYSGVRGGRGRQHDAHFPRYLKALYAALTEQGLGPDRLAWTYNPDAAHTESAWAERLPEALAFIGQGWWSNWLRRQGGSTLVTSPQHLAAGVDGQLLFFNRTASSTLSRLAPGTSLKVSLGVDGWQAAQQLHLEPLSSGSCGLVHHIEPPAALQQEVFQAWGLDPQLQEHLHKRLLDTTVRKGASSRAGRVQGATTAAAAAAGNSTSTSGDDWYVLRLPAPPVGCSRLDMAFCDGEEKVWDNNSRQDFHLAVSAGVELKRQAAVPRRTAVTSRGGGAIALAALAAAPSSATSSAASFSSRAATAQGPAATVLRMLDSLRLCAIGDGCGFISPDALHSAEAAVLHGANTPAQDAAAVAEASGQLMFMLPQQPVAGLPAALYINKAQLSEVLMRAPSMCLQVGFNEWSTGVQKVAFRPAALRRDGAHDWWYCRVSVPEDSHQGAYAICGVYGGNENWDNNQGADYRFSVMSLEAAVVQAVAGACIGLDMVAARRSRSQTVTTDKPGQQMMPSKLVHA